MRLASSLLLGSLLTGALVGCAALADPAEERDQALDVLLLAVQEGDGSAFCTQLNVMSPGGCSSPILSSPGIADAFIQNFPIDELTEIHSITQGPFEVELVSYLTDTSDGEQYVFSLQSLVLPSLELPVSGTFEGQTFRAEDKVDFMPSVQSPAIELDPSSDEAIKIAIAPGPWVNKPSHEITWADGFEPIVRERVLAECEAAKQSITLKSLESGNREYLYAGSLFKPASEFLTTRFRDGTVYDRDARYVNSPTELELSECTITSFSAGKDSVELAWRSDISFQGVIGEKNERKNYFTDNYTGAYLDMAFTTSIQGFSRVAISYRDMKSELLNGGWDLLMPLTAEPLQ